MKEANREQGKEQGNLIATRSMGQQETQRLAAAAFASIVLDSSRQEHGSQMEVA